MSQKIDWAKYIAEAEKNIASKISSSENNELNMHYDRDKSLVEMTSDIEIRARDLKSPLYSVKTFEALNLNPNLLKGVYEMGLVAPSKIQKTVLPLSLVDPPQNLIVQAPSGTGKTTSFTLAMLSRVDVSKKYPQVLCLSPSFELAIEIGEVAAHMTKFCAEIEIKLAVRGEEVPRGAKLTEHIIIGTPGKVLEWAMKFKVFDVKKISVFVLDEADVMIAQQGHPDQCIRIHRNLSPSCQMIFGLAKYDQEVMDFAEHIVKNPVTIKSSEPHRAVLCKCPYHSNNVSKQSTEVKNWAKYVEELDKKYLAGKWTVMSQKIDWAKYVAEAEKNITNKISAVEISSDDQKQGAVRGDDEEAPEQFSPAEASLLAKVIRKGLVESKTDIEVQRKDPKSPLYSVKSFEALNLNPNLLKGVYEMGFNAPSKIQETALPTLLADPPQNLIAQSQSGTGKTAAFVLAMLSRVDVSKKYPQVLCLSPTYELAIQTGEVAAHMAKFCPEIEMKFAVRGEEVPRGAKLTEHIIIGTPGKVLDWAIKFKVFDLKKISVFVLDEADVMIAQQGHQDQCIRIHKNLSPTCQMMFFSATYDQEVMDFAEHIVKNPITIRLRREEESLNNIAQYYVRCANAQEKYNAVTNIYGVVGVGQAIIFCHTRKTAAWLSEKMSKDGHAVAVLSGDLTVEQRINVLDRFRQGTEKVLITTNVLSRGIDVEQVTIVVNFDLPVDVNGKADCETYLHRIGRTGRFGKKGIAINLVDSDQTMAILKTIERHFNKKINYLNADDSDEIERIGN